MGAGGFPGRLGAWGGFSRGCECAGSSQLSSWEKDATVGVTGVAKQPGRRRGAWCGEGGLRGAVVVNASPRLLVLRRGAEGGDAGPGP